ncbi:MAG: 50S ribosomal protein L11 methyltransferase, partial [Bacteroidota bacterium]
MPKSFTEIEINADPQLNEQLVAILSQLGFEGFWEEGNALRCYVRSTRWSDAMFNEVQNVANTIHRSSTSLAPKMSVRIVEDKNWNEEWEKTIQPIHVTERIVITPTWHVYKAEPGELVLTIDPKMSFGTGVLAIAGIKLGASSAIGVDNDDWSYDNAIENINMNHVQDNVKIIRGELANVPSGKFDMIVANIQRNVIEPLLSEMKSRLNPDGAILLSGLLTVDEEPMRKAVRGVGFEIREMLTENEWVALAVS